MTTTIPGAVEGTTMQVHEVESSVIDFATTDGRYFVDAEVMLDQLHGVVHAVMEEVKALGDESALGLDDEQFGAAGHILLNLVADGFDRLRMHITMHLMLGDDDALARLLSSLGDEFPEA